MKRLSPKAKRVLERVVRETTTVREILTAEGVPTSTYYRWRQDPLWSAELERATRDFEKELRVKFASRRRRIEELSRLYETIPVATAEYWQSGLQKRTHLHVALKVAVLDQIRSELAEIGGNSDDPSSDQSADLLARRQIEARQLEEFTLQFTGV